MSLKGGAANLEVNKTTEAVIGAAIEVHRHLGPGLLESAYEECLCQELKLRNIPFKRQVPLPVNYKGIQLDCGYRLASKFQPAYSQARHQASRTRSQRVKTRRTLRLCGEK